MKELKLCIFYNELINFNMAKIYTDYIEFYLQTFPLNKNKFPEYFFL